MVYLAIRQNHLLFYFHSNETDSEAELNYGDRKRIAIDSHGTCRLILPGPDKVFEFDFVKSTNLLYLTHLHNVSRQFDPQNGILQPDEMTLAV